MWSNKYKVSFTALFATFKFLIRNNLNILNYLHVLSVWKSAQSNNTFNEIKAATLCWKQMNAENNGNQFKNF